MACSDVTVAILDRPRHAAIIKECRQAGARIRLISDGDVGAAIEVAKEGSPVDVLIGIGGTPEGRCSELPMLETPIGLIVWIIGSMASLQMVSSM